MPTLVINTDYITHQVPIILEGKRDSVRIMHRSRAFIEEGAIVDPNFLATNPKIKVTVPKQASAPAASNQSSTQTVAPKE